MSRVVPHAAGLCVRPNLLLASPTAPWRRSAHHRKIELLHLAVFKEPAVRRDRPRVFSEEQHAAGIGIETMNVAQESEITRPRPIISSAEGGLDGERKIAPRAVPGIRRQQPTGGLIQ